MQTEKASVREKFDREAPQWDALYVDQDPSARGFQERQDAGVALCRAFVREGGRILDAGCGAGHAAISLAGSGFDVLGVDIAEQMIGQAETNAARASLVETCRFRVGDIERDAAALGAFDGVLALGFVEYFDDPLRILRTLYGMLRPGGVLVVQIWNSRSIAALLEEPVCATVRALRDPVGSVRSGMRRVVPDSLLRRYRSWRGTAALPPADVEHRRYSPGQLRAFAQATGFTEVGSSGVRLFSPRSLLPAGVRLRHEARFVELVRRHPSLRRVAGDYIAVLRRPDVPQA